MLFTEFVCLLIGDHLYCRIGVYLTDPLLCTSLDEPYMLAYHIGSTEGVVSMRLDEPILEGHRPCDSLHCIFCHLLKILSLVI